MCGTMMPTKPIGPPSETAAPVASEALRNAMRCVFRTSTPRAAALSGPRFSKFSERGSHAKAAPATMSKGSAQTIGV